MLPADAFIAKNMTVEESIQAIRETQRLLSGLVQFTAEEMEGPMRELAQKLGLKAGQLFGIVRNAVTGKEVSPPLFGSLQAVGRERTLKRLEKAEQILLAHLA